ncbi:hypothetical protein ZOSMA_11G00250 [Zostera marina]|uniref:Uncharacterized protein n=1 Tax=Zostera marina TaxID=29655 RepID=A0A0K9Q1G2_ZOSMR|nr:hypothetical protein ZOSMA_11G00250 [Zostera marina]
MAESRRYEKFRQIVQRNENCKIAFCNLKSEIRIGLIEAREVFESLSIPLMKLIGAKEGEMSDEGRSSSVVFVPPDILDGNRLRNATFSASNRNTDHQKSDDLSRRNESFSNFDQHQKRSNDDELSNATTRLLSVCEELKESQDHHIRRVINLLRTTEFHVKTRHNSILETLEAHNASLRRFLQKSTNFFSTHPHTSPSTSNLTSRIFRAVYEHSVSSLDAVSGDIEGLLECLTEKMCTPMVAYVKKLREDMESIQEMEATLATAMMEVERVKKRARIADEEKAEAFRLYKEYEEKFYGMKKIVLRSIPELQNHTNPAVQQLQLTQQSGGDRRPVTRSSTQKNPSPSNLSMVTCVRRGVKTKKRN